MPATVEATCLCGKARERLTLGSDLPVKTKTCSCDTCRYTTGVLYLSTLPLPEKPLMVDVLQFYDSSDSVTKYFCDDCGSYMLMSRERGGWSSSKSWFLCSGAIDQLVETESPAPSIEDPAQHEFVGDTRDGGLITCFAKSNPASWLFLRNKVRLPLNLTQNPPPWPALERLNKPTWVDQDSMLQACCHCGGVSFWISRPTHASVLCSSPWPDLLVPYHSNDSANPEDVKWWLRERRKYLAGTCACRSCRLGSGVPIQTWAFIPKKNLMNHPQGVPLEFSHCSSLKRFESSPGKFREFCEQCGATVFWHCDERPDVVDVSVGLLRANEGSRAETWLDWHTERVSFKEQALDLPLIEAFERGLSSLHAPRHPQPATLSTYVPIKPFEEIRVLLLSPALQYLDALEGELMNVMLNNCGPYEALSYVWGDPSKRSSISIAGKQMGITSNLDTALRHLRHPDQPRYLWVDALCINQTDVAERSIHVQYMKDVYSHSTRDILWLGPNGWTIAKFLQTITDVGNLMDVDEHAYRFLMGVEQGWTDIVGAIFEDPPVWKRLWIMQEVSAAPDVILMAGRETMPWSVVEKWLGTDRFIKKYGIPDAFHGPYSHDSSARNLFNAKIAYPQILSHQRRIMQGQVPESPKHDWGTSAMDVLARFRYTQATEPKDKIYGLLGLLPKKDLVTTVDYGMSVGDLYAQVAKSLIQQSGNLDLLCQGPWELGQAMSDSRHLRRTDLPSWVPDFSNPGESRIMFAQRHIFQADRAVATDFSFSPMAESRCLILEGWSLDTLSFVGKQLEKHNLHLQQASRIQDLLLDWTPHQALRFSPVDGNPPRDRYEQPEKDPSNSGDTSDPQAIEAFWRTVMLDCCRGPDYESLHRIRDTEIEELNKPFERMQSKETDHDLWFGMSWQDWDHLKRMCLKWSFALSTAGNYCMAPQSARPGDQIVVLKGAKVPVVLREQPAADGQKRWSWVGTCYVHEYMDGRIVNEQGEEGVEQWSIV